MKYKRYIVFANNCHGNTDAMGSVALDTWSRRDAMKFNDGSDVIVVFDRVEGEVIKETFNTNKRG